VKAHAARPHGRSTTYGDIGRSVSRTSVRRTARWSAPKVRGDYSPDINFNLGPDQDSFAADPDDRVKTPSGAGANLVAAGWWARRVFRETVRWRRGAARRFGDVGLVGGQASALRHAGIPKRPGGRPAGGSQALMSCSRRATPCRRKQVRACPAGLLRLVAFGGDGRQSAIRRAAKRRSHGTSIGVCEAALRSEDLGPTGH